MDQFDQLDRPNRNLPFHFPTLVSSLTPVNTPVALGNGTQNGKDHSARLAQFNQEMSFHFALVYLGWPNWSDCENGKHPRTAVFIQIHQKGRVRNFKSSCPVPLTSYQNVCLPLRYKLLGPWENNTNSYRNEFLTLDKDFKLHTCFCHPNSSSLALMSTRQIGSAWEKQTQQWIHVMIASKRAFLLKITSLPFTYIFTMILCRSLAYLY